MKNQCKLGKCHEIDMDGGSGPKPWGLPPSPHNSSEYIRSKLFTVRSGAC